MKEEDFLEKWNKERQMYEAWGDFVSSSIFERLKQDHRDIDTFLKQPHKYRLKSDTSLLDKAFYRPTKDYENPYSEIEDKVGCRFVVLLVEQIDEIAKIIKKEKIWNAKECRHFNSDREKDPLLFTYQSVHYVVRPKKNINHLGHEIMAGTPCEIQIRTLLQHAYAELTHDAIYKAKQLVEPAVHRTVAKSMALIETTDDFFSDVHNRINSCSSEHLCIQAHLDDLYENYVGMHCTPAQKSSIAILSEYDHLITEDLIDNIEKLLKKEYYLSRTIKTELGSTPFYSQSIILFVYWLLKKKRNTLLENWPVDFKIIEKLSTDVGVSLDTNH